MVKSKQHKRKVKHQFGNPPHHLKKEPYMPRITFCIPSKNNLRLAKELTACKVFKVKRYYANYLWIIIMRRNNEIVRKLNMSCGFKIARKATEQIALENFLIDPRDYIVMEMKL